jgi:hypothetical protein
MKTIRDFLVVAVLAFIISGAGFSIYFSRDSRYVSAGEGFVIDTRTGISIAIMKSTVNKDAYDSIRIQLLTDRIDEPALPGK